MGATYDFSGLRVLVDALVEVSAAGNLEVAKRTRRAIQESFGSYGRYKAGPVGKPPNKRRSALYNSFQVAGLTGGRAAVTTNSRYAFVHELGATIRPKVKKALTIPLNQAAAALSEDKGLRSLRDYNFRPIKSKSGNLILVGNFLQKVQYYKTTGGKRRYVKDESSPVFILKRSVYIPPRPYAKPALEKLRGTPAFQAWVFGANRIVSRRFPGITFREGAL